ncbi:MAG: hypothetical protein GY757_22275 [bacterium]|nr:hypothetical protein [bacterium]
MICLEFTKQLDYYLKNELSEKNRETFEAHYFECDNCFAELKLQERLYSKEVPIVLTGKKTSFIFDFLVPKWKPSLVLASFLVMVLISLSFFNTGSQHLYELSQFEPPLYIKSETREPVKGASFTRAMSFYNQRDYSRVLKELSTLDSSNNAQVLFFKGICCLLAKKQQPKKAIGYFNTIIANMNPNYYDEALYHKGIALLRLNRKEAAITQFKIIAEMFSPYSQKAKKLLKELDC